MKIPSFRRIVLSLGLMAGVLIGVAFSQDSHGVANREAIDKMRDRDLQPEKIMEAVGFMIVVLRPIPIK